MRIYKCNKNQRERRDSDLIGNLGNVMISESVLLKATKLPIGFFTYSLSGSSYLSDDLPNNSYKYGSAVILKRSPTSIVVALFGIDSAPLAFNFYNGSDWAGWRIYITNSVLDVERVAFIEGGVWYKANKFVLISLNKTITKDTIGWNTLSSNIPTAKDICFAPYTSGDLTIQGMLSVSKNTLEIDIPSNAVGKTFTVRGQIMYRLA